MIFDEWRDRQDPETVPYRPGAKHTQGFGLRITDIGSPLHLGNDRGREPTAILAPFDCRYIWRRTDGVAGSVLQLIPRDGRGDVEIQVFHTTESDHTETIDGCSHRGETLPVHAGDLGLSAGVHTHTELVMRYTTELRSQVYQHDMIWLYRNGRLNTEYIEGHCERHGLDYADVIDKTTEQVHTWGIQYASTRFAIRKALPKYRTPHWGPGQTIHVDTLWALQI